MDVPWYHPHPVRPSSSSPSSTSSSAGGPLPSPSLRQLQLQALLSTTTSPTPSGSRPPPDGSAVTAPTDHVDPAAALKARVLGPRPVDVPPTTHFPPSPPPDGPAFAIGPSSGLTETYGQASYGHGGMDQSQAYLDLHQPHMSAGPPSNPPPATSGTVGHYAQYGHPPLLQPVPAAAYPSAQGSYAQYPYANGIGTSQTGSHPSAVATAGSHVPAQLLPLPSRDRLLSDCVGTQQSCTDFFGLFSSSYGACPTTPAWVRCYSGRPRISAAAARHYRPGSAIWNESTSHGDVVGG